MILKSPIPFSHKVYWISILCLPSFNGYIGQSNAQLFFYVTSLALIALLLMSKMGPSLHYSPLGRVLISPLLIFLIYLFSTGLNYQYLGGGDILEILRPIIYTFILLLPLYDQRNYDFIDFLNLNKPLIFFAPL